MTQNGISRRPTEAQLTDIADAYRANSMNVSATSRETGIPRQTIRRWLIWAEESGLIGGEELHDPIAPLRDGYLSAKARKQERYQKKKKKGTWDKPVLVNIPDGPFRLKLFGDPHLDADGCDFDLFEKHWSEMSVEGRVYGVCIGDWFNNWLKVLAHLWKHEGDPDDAWTLFEYLMHQNGNALLGACSGNHDDWTHGPVDPIDMLMKQHGVVYRQGAVRLFVDAGGQGPITIALRHKWKGHSMYSPAHGLRRAAAEGWHDHIMVGGHTHVDEDRHYIQPRTGFMSHLFQLSAFKKFDDFADVHGFKPHSISPVRDLVIQPDKADDDPDKVMAFYSSDEAARYFNAL